MGRRCCVANCPSTSRLPEHHGVTYHSFPLDAVIRAIWIKNSRISLDRKITKSVLVCSRHFRRLDFNPIRNGKYLLKARVFPTVFPWGKMDSAEVEADHRALEQVTLDGALSPGATNSSTNEDVIKVTVDQIVSQILAETTQRNVAAEVASAAADKADEDAATPVVEESVEVATSSGTPIAEEPAVASSDATTPEANVSSPTPTSPVKYGPLTNIIIGARLEALNSEDAWLPARIVEINDAEQTLLIRFDRNNKQKVPPAPGVSNQEWMSIKSERLRQRISARVLPVFDLEEKCMARWSGPRKFPGTIKKLLGNDTYEVLFDDGYSKNVRAVHMNKLPRQLGAIEGVATPTKRPSVGSSATILPSGSSNKKGKSAPQRKDWPLLDMSTLDLAALGLPEIPRDGEWTCHWVNDQPIGTEGFLIVGEHHKPTVIVQDWRLPPGWIKHMYQRSNVLGKWDVILVSPSGKRFRSKSDLKLFLESQGLTYNPDVYDFSIHRRRAKDINAYVYTHDYSPQQPHKPKNLNVSLDTSATLEQTTAKLPVVPATPLASVAPRTESQYMEAPVASLMPPAELMSPQATAAEEAKSAAGTSGMAGLSTGVDEHGGALLQNGYAYIGGLKVQITDNLFVCPNEGCGKTYRKEDFLQIHIRHYHKEFAQHVSHCPKMQELAVKRTHPSSIEQTESTPKNQIPNQQFFAKLHQQDLQQSRSVRRQAAASTSPTAPTTSTPPIQAALISPTKTLTSPNMEVVPSVSSPSTGPVPTGVPANVAAAPVLTGIVSTTPVRTVIRDRSKRPRVSSSRRSSGSRKSNRHRVQRRYTNVPPRRFEKTDLQALDSEETRHSVNTPTHDTRGPSEAKRRRLGGLGTPISSIDSPATVDSISTPSSNEQGDINAALVPPPPVSAPPQYIKEDGQIIRIVTMRQEEIINCICEYGEEDGLMVQCELCLCWQHGACNGIAKESDVPDKYVCYICRNPQRVRDSMRFKHDQDWLFEGRLPTASYYTANPQAPKQFSLLKHSHTLTGNLLDTKRSMHSLLVKVNIAKNRYHPKLYLWAKKWDEDSETSATPTKRPKIEQENMPHVPQPEAAIDPEECQYRLIEHVKVQQGLVADRLKDIEAELDELEKEDDLPDLKDATDATTKDALATYIKDLEILKRVAKLNSVANTLKNIKEVEAASATPTA